MTTNPYSQEDVDSQDGEGASRENEKNRVSQTINSAQCLTLTFLPVL